MKHFTADEWKAFYLQEGIYNEEAMENHLLECDNCNRLFLQCIDDQQFKRHEKLIPQDFTPRTLHYIKQNGLKQSNRTTPTKLRIRLLTSYALAASLTLMLMGSGVFKSLTAVVNTIPIVDTSTFTQGVASFLFHWPDQVKGSTWDKIDKLQMFEGKEVEK